MDDEQKKLAQARIDKQMVEGFERIFSKRYYKSSKMEDRKWFRQVRKGKWNRKRTRWGGNNCGELRQTRAAVTSESGVAGR